MTETPTQPSPPVRERGYARQSPGEFWSDLTTEKTPELRWPACLEVYEDMNDQDGQVGSAFDAVVTPILSAKRRLHPNGARDEVVEHVANDLGIPIVGVDDDDEPKPRRRGRFSLREHHAVAVPDHLQFGHAVFEQLYRQDEAGLFHLAKLGYRPPRTIATFHTARDGGLDAITQWAPGHLSPGIGVWTMGEVGVRLPINRLVIYVNGRKGSTWTGRSIFRRCYKNWLLKDRLLRRYDQVTDRNGMGIPVYEAAGTGQTEIDAGQEIVESLRGGDDSGVSHAMGAKLRLMGVEGTLIDLLQGVKYHDEQIARSMLANVLNLGQNRGTGSWSLGTTLQDILALSVNAVTENVNEIDNKHIVEDLVEVNWGPDEPAPRIVVDEVGNRNDAIVAAIAQLVTAGVLGADESLETFIRTTLGLPPRQGGEPTVIPTVPQEDS